MTQLSYYGTPAATAPHRGGLIAWGTVLIAAGALFACGGIFGMTALVIMTARTTGSPSVPPILKVIGAVLVAIGMHGSLIWVGIGCCQGKRWARPLVLIGCVFAMVTGALSIIPNTLAVGKMFSQSMTAPATTAPMFSAGAQPPPIAAAIGGVVGVIIMVGLLIVVPAFMFMFFRRETVRQSLEITDPTPRWTDTVPLPLLGWVVGSVMLGLSDIATGLNGLLPFFTVLLTGPIAMIAMAMIGLILIAGGVLSYRRSMLGWGLSMGMAILMAASMGTFALLGDGVRYQQLLLSGFDRAVQKNAANSFAGANPNLVYAMTWATAVGYGIWLRKRINKVTVDA